MTQAFEQAFINDVTAIFNSGLGNAETFNSSRLSVISSVDGAQLVIRVVNNEAPLVLPFPNSHHLNLTKFLLAGT